MAKQKNSKKLAHVVAVDMGYGHQRPAHALAFLSDGEVVSANNYKGITKSDLKIWESGRQFYEMISRFKGIPFVGSLAFGLFDKFQKIYPYYPIRDLSGPSLQLKQIYKLIRKGWGVDLIRRLSKNPLPLITTFFTVAFMAEEHGYPGQIYCLTTDSDVSRAWVPENPRHTCIHYLASTKRVQDRLGEYGIPEKQITFTGFPLEKINLGDEKFSFTKKVILDRLKNLDPNLKYTNIYRQDIERYLGTKALPEKSDRPLTLTFAIGGSAAQVEIGLQIMKSLEKDIHAHKIKLNLVAATHVQVRDLFLREATKLNLKDELGKFLQILWQKNKPEYFEAFNNLMNETDVLWTKPSELCFWAALGIPIIIATPLGSQEDSNRRWLRAIGSGLDQQDPKFTHEWFWDFVNEGYLAKAAMQGFVEMPKGGVFKIERIIKRNPKS